MASTIGKSFLSMDVDDDMEDLLSSILNDKKDKNRSTDQVTEPKQSGVTQPLSTAKQNALQNKNEDDDEFDSIIDNHRKSSTTDFSRMNISGGDPKTSVDRPPTRSGSRTVTASEKGLIDDGADSLFSSLGLGSPREEGSKVTLSATQGLKGKSLVGTTGKTSSGSRKALDDLLSFNSFDDVKSGPRKLSRDNFSLGGYTPTAADIPRPSTNKRLVRFKSNEKSFDNEDKENPSLLMTAPASLASINNNKEPDWLSDLGVGGAKAKETERPRSVGSAAGIAKDDSLDFDDVLGQTSKNPRKNTAEPKPPLPDSSRRQSVVNILKLDGRDDDDDVLKGIRRPSASSAATSKSGFSLDFLKILDEEVDDLGGLDKKDNKTMAADSKNQKGITSDKMKSSTQVDQSGMEHLTNQIKLLEADKEFLLEKIERMKQQHEEEKGLIEHAFSKRVQLAEETFEKCQDRLRQENEILSQDILEKVRALEKEKSEMFASHLERMKKMERERSEEVERMRNDYRVTIESMRQEHEDSLQRILRTKNQELDVVMSSRDHVKKLESALTYLEVNTADLDDLRNKVRSRAEGAELDQQLAMKLKESSLNAMQDRMTDREKEMEEEKNRLLNLISRMEQQLTSQNSQMENERWQARQEEARLKVERCRLEEERREFMEMSQRERMELEKMKTKFQSERATVTAELRGERSRLAEERAGFEVEMRLKEEELERLRASNHQSETEVSATKRAMAEKMNELERRLRQVREAEVDLAEQRRKLEERKSEVEREKKALDRVAQQMHSGSKELMQKFEELEEERERYRLLVADARAKDAESSERLETICSMVQKYGSGDYSGMETSAKPEPSSLRNLSNNAQNSQKQVRFDFLSLLSPEERNLYENLRNKMPSTSSEANHSSGHSSLQFWGGVVSGNVVDRSLREWRASFLKDMSYLEREKYFVHAVKNMSRVFS